jgi:predicted PurR-regulated permease PerM
MAQQKVQLRKIRDFGENISDTFSFIRQEFKPLVSSFVYIAGIFILGNAIFSGLYQKHAFDFLDQFSKGIYAPRQTLSQLFSPVYFLLLACMLLSLSVMRTVIAVYLKYYDETGMSPTVQEVWKGVIKYFFGNLLFSILHALMFVIGLVFCIAPGVWILVVLMPYPFIITIENKSIGETFRRCFEITKENFWMSLAIYLVSYIIYAFSSGIIGFGVSLIVGLISYFTTKELSTTAAVVTSILSIVQYLFYIIFFISVGLHYYNLVETREGTGLARRLESLGNNANLNSGIEEQY